LFDLFAALRASRSFVCRRKFLGSFRRFLHLRHARKAVHYPLLPTTCAAPRGDGSAPLITHNQRLGAISETLSSDWSSIPGTTAPNIPDLFRGRAVSEVSPWRLGLPKTGLRAVRSSSLSRPPRNPSGRPRTGRALRPASGVARARPPSVRSAQLPTQWLGVRLRPSSCHPPLMHVDRGGLQRNGGRAGQSAPTLPCRPRPGSASPEPLSP